MTEQVSDGQGSVTQMDALPTYIELPRLGHMGSSWGLWGRDDRLGCLNLLGRERVRAATREIKTGRVYPLDLAMTVPDPPVLSRREFIHVVHREPGLGDVEHFEDDIVSDWNTQRGSQWDGFRHVSRAGFGCYGGLAGEAHGVDHWSRRGIVGRAVLVDIARWRETIGRPVRHQESDLITAADLRSCLTAQRVSLDVGDILLIRTGWLAWYQSLGQAERNALGDDDQFVSGGLDATEEMAALLWDLHVSALAADNPAVEAWPPTPEASGELHLLHTRLVAMLGLPIGEMFGLEGLADYCAETGTYYAFLTSAPLNLAGGTGSPPNAIAVV